MKAIARSVILAACVVGAAASVVSMSAQAPTYTWVLLAGGESFSHRDDVGTRARFSRPEAIVQDAAGVIYVADAGSHTIRRVGTDRAVTTIAGAPDVAGSADGIGTAARFSRPSGLVVDSAGVLWVADSGNYTIRRIATNGEVTTLGDFPARRASL
jgi:sugar lactone lactonase YvrE